MKKKTQKKGAEEKDSVRDKEGRVQESPLITRRKRERSYLSVVFFLSFILLLIIADDLFIHLYQKMSGLSSSEKEFEEELPSFFSPLQYHHTFPRNETLELQIILPRDEEITLNPSVSISLRGEIFKAVSSRGQVREAVFRFRIDDTKDVLFPGGNNMSIPLDDHVEISFDLSEMGFLDTRAPYKLTAEVFLPVLSSDEVYRECEKVDKFVLRSSHSIHFFYIPFDPSFLENRLENKKEKDLIDTDSRISSTMQHSDGTSSLLESSEVTSLAPKNDHDSAFIDLVVPGEDAFPEFQITKMISLSYLGGCTRSDVENNNQGKGAFKIGINFHPKTLAYTFFGKDNCVAEFLDKGSLSPTCNPASIVLTYKGENYDISNYIRSQADAFKESSALRHVRDCSNVACAKMKAVGPIDLTLEGVELSPTEQTEHLVLLYVCEGIRENPAPEMLHKCTQEPFVWDALLVQCASMPSSQAN